ncbi:hypothetical protein BS78_05G190800 [Paspalum vaginatum]|nr:hypothetical protein BS78_05G190800 [Paspalum vaginatum]
MHCNFVPVVSLLPVCLPRFAVVIFTSTYYRCSCGLHNITYMIYCPCSFGIDSTMLVAVLTLIHVLCHRLVRCSVVNGFRVTATVKSSLHVLSALSTFFDTCDVPSVKQVTVPWVQGDRCC